MSESINSNGVLGGAQRPLAVCVHQIGKVGSRTLVKSLEDALPGRKIYHTHRLSEPGLARSTADYLTSGLSAIRRIAQNSNLKSTFECSVLLEHGVSSYDWRIINVTREPVGRSVSAFFQNFRNRSLRKLREPVRGLCLRAIDARAGEWPLDGAEEAVVADGLAELYRSEYMAERCEPWYIREMQGVFGVDVFATPFDKAAGYSVFRRGTVNVLVVNLERLSECFSAAVDELFVGSPPGTALKAVNPTHEHDSGGKEYSGLYGLFKARKCVAPDALEAQLNGKFAKHFYTDEFLDSVRQKWT